MDKSERNFWITAGVSLAFIGLLSFAITFAIRSWQIDRYVDEQLKAAVDGVEETDSPDIAAMKIGYGGKTYTIDEFLRLDEIPVIVDILIMESDGSISNRQSYVSCAVDGSEEIRYVDGVYGRLIIPMKYSERLVDEDAG